MSLPSSLRQWLHLPSRIALLLGVGALTAAAAKPAIAEPDLHEGPVRAPQQSAKSFGEVLIWGEQGRIYFSEGGKAARELHLGDTAEARRLRQLLERDGASANSPRVLQYRMILVGGGGQAIHWGGAPSSSNPDQAGRPAAERGTKKVIDSNKGKPPAQTEKEAKTNVAGADRRN